MAEEQKELGISYVTIDGIEGKLARVELPGGTTEDWRLSSLPKGVKEGDVIRIDVQGGDAEMKIDHAETDRRRNSALVELAALNADAPEGEIDL